VVIDPFATTPPAVAAPAATPPLVRNVLDHGKPATAVLNRMAAAAEKDTSLPGDQDGPHIVRTESWALSTRIGDKKIASAVVPEITELRWNADRSGYIRTRTGKPYFPDAEYKAAWKEDGSPGRSGTVVEHHTWKQGGFAPMFPNLPLPSEADRLLAALEAAHPIDKEGTSELVVAIDDLFSQCQPGPEVRAGISRLLAARSDIVSLGQMTDRAGRSVQAFAVDSDLGGLPKRQVLMFSPTTATLLASEEILTKKPGKLQVRIPAVISYRLYFPAH
jgi:hypothetical protein